MGVVAVPVTSTALFVNQQVQQGQMMPSEIRQKALEDRVRLRLQQRKYWDAADQFDASSGEVMPDINTMESIQKSLRPAAQKTVEILDANDLDPSDRLFLRNYTHSGNCPESLKGFHIPGFYELCVSIVGEDVKQAPVTGLLNNRAYLNRTLGKSAPNLSAFKLRMQMIQEANDSATRREDGTGPGRPTVCVMNPDCLNPRYGD